MIDLPKEQSPCYCCEVINGHRPDCPYFILQDIISKHNMIVTASGQPKTGELLDK